MNIIKPEFFQQRSKQKSEQKSPGNFDKIIEIYLESPLMEENNINLIFDWASQLYKSKLFNDEEYFINLIFDIPKKNEIVIKRILDLFNGICSIKNSENINYYNIIIMIIKRFKDNPEMISAYGIIIIKELIKSINIEVLFEEIANNLLMCNDI